MKAAALAALVVLSACSSLVPADLPEEPPPLADMEEPLELFAEPPDEPSRAALPAGGFTGLTLAAAPETLEDAAAGVAVESVAENSPADAAGVREGDLLLAVRLPSGEEREIRYASEWRRIELDAAPGAELALIVDRAGVEATARLTVAKRARAPGRAAAERFRETQKAGVVLRTATEVEARAAGLGPGGGAVVVGLSKRSPWRTAGLRFGDLLVEAGGKPVAHAQVVLDAIREADEAVDLAYVRDGVRRDVEAPLTTRESEMTSASVPPLFSYESDRGKTELSILLGLFRHRTTPAAWDTRIFFLFSFSGGDADLLTEVSE